MNPIVLCVITRALLDCQVTCYCRGFSLQFIWQEPGRPGWLITPRLPHLWSLIPLHQHLFLYLYTLEWGKTWLLYHGLLQSNIFVRTSKMRFYWSHISLPDSCCVVHSWFNDCILDFDDVLELVSCSLFVQCKILSCGFVILRTNRLQSWWVLFFFAIAERRLSHVGIPPTPA